MAPAPTHCSCRFHTPLKSPAPLFIVPYYLLYCVCVSLCSNGLTPSSCSIFLYRQILYFFFFLSLRTLLVPLFYTSIYMHSSNSDTPPPHESIVVASRSLSPICFTTLSFCFHISGLPLPSILPLHFFRIRTLYSMCFVAYILSISNPIDRSQVVAIYQLFMIN